MAKYISRAAIAAAALALGVSGAYASVYGNGTLNVSVNVEPTCNIVVGDITFTKIIGGARTTEDIKPSSIAVNCNTAAWHLSVDDNLVERSMKNGEESLKYKLCNPTPTAGYNSCVPFNQNSPITGTTLTDNVTVFGIMEGGVLPPKPGDYKDAVRIQVTN
jgi:spore coat protein U-like protein